MNNELNLSYYYGAEAEQFAFFRIPKLLFTDSRFSHISTEVKLLYGRGCGHILGLKKE